MMVMKKYILIPALAICLMFCACSTVNNPLENTKLLYENKFIDQKNGGISTPKRNRNHVEDNYEDSDYEPNWVEAF